MALENESVLSEIVLQAGLITRKDLEKCLKIQQAQTDPKDLSAILLEEGYLTREQLQMLLNFRMGRETLYYQRAKKDIIFGRLAVKLGLLDENVLSQCLRTQPAPDEDCVLAEVMVKNGYLTTDDVAQITGFQSSRVITCPQCQLVYNTLLFKSGARFSCFHCDTKLEVPA